MSCPALGPRVIDRPRDSGSGGFAPSSPAQPRLRAAPLRSSPWPSQLAGSFFKAVTKKTCRRREFLLSPGGCFFAFFAGYGGAASSILPRRACPCEYVARRPPHRRWVQETQPHTCGCAERILTAEFQPPGKKAASARCSACGNLRNLRNFPYGTKEVSDYPRCRPMGGVAEKSVGLSS